MNIYYISVTENVITEVIRVDNGIVRSMDPHSDNRDDNHTDEDCRSGVIGFYRFGCTYIRRIYYCKCICVCSINYC